MTLHFAQPVWLAAGLAVCVLIFIFLRISAAGRSRALAAFAAPETCERLTKNVSTLRRRIKNILFLAAVAACFVALARPQYGEEWREVRQKGIDILIALDTSRSMLTRDIQPNRLERAKLAIKDFVGRLEGDRVGLMPFAGSTFLMCPLTTDYGAFMASLDALGPDTIPLGGTDLAGVITGAMQTLANEANHKILILVTDGEDLKGAALQAAEKAAAQNMTIYTIGVGTPEGELIPSISNGAGAYVKDATGNFVRSKLDAITLTKIAQITGGLYVPLGNMGQGFATVYQQKLKLVPKQEHHERMQRRPLERFYWPLDLALVFLTLEFLLSGRKSSRSFGIPLIKTAGRRLLNHRISLIVFMILLAGPLPRANGSTGDELYHAENYDQAEQAYAKALEKEPENAILHFNLGDVQYKKNEYEKAISSYTKALNSDDLHLQAKSYYNRGNARYRQGKAVLKTDLQQTMELYRQAVADYEGSLALNPDDKDAIYNRDLVRRQLDELEKQQEQKQQDRKNQQENQETENQDKGNSGQDSKNQSQSDSGRKKDGRQQKDADARSGEDNQQSQTEQAADKNSTSTHSDNGKKQESGHREENTTDNETDQNPQGQQKEDKEGGFSGTESGKSDKTGKTGGMSKADRTRREQGKMTTQEAQGLLDAIEDEEGRLDFIPQGTGDNRQGQPLKNW